VSQKLIITQPFSSTSFSYLKPWLDFLTTAQGLMVCLLIALAVVLHLLAPKKGKLASGRWAGRAEKNQARKIALEQIGNRQKNEVSVWLGSLSSSNNTLFLPDAQRGISVIGGPGTGKTVSVIDRLALSVLAQGFPAILYDFKYPAQSSRLAPYAAKCGYDVRIFAPGYPESEVCNPLDFLADEQDAMMAGQLAEVLNANFKRNSNNQEDAFFSPAGIQLTEALLLLAKSSKCPNLITCQELASLETLPQYIQANRATLNPWVYKSFGQFISTAKSDRTIASILGTANLNLTRLIKPDLLAALCGPTTISTRLEGKQLLVIGLDREKRQVISPLIAAIVALLINKNVSLPRHDPLFLLADEIPTLFLPSLHHYLNENREDGLCTVLGFQNIVQMEKMYGRELARAIVGGCATKVIFNPQDYDSAKLFSDFLGQKEVHLRQKSYGRSHGKRNITYTQQIQTKPLFDAADFLRLPKGRCLILNPHLARGNTAYIPLLKSIRLTRAYKCLLRWSTSRWEKVRAKLIQRSPQGKMDARTLLLATEAIAEILPNSPEPNNNVQTILDKIL
jgi:type IV secretory pathway TraG/TraD family ATPase VirD4